MPLPIPPRALASAALLALVAGAGGPAACAGTTVPVAGAAGVTPSGGDTIALFRIATPAAGSTALRLRARNGAVVVRAGPDDSVRVTLAIGAAVEGASSGRCESRQAQSTLTRLEEAGGVVEPDVRGGRDFGCLDYWEIEVPARFAVDVRGGRASVRVAGVAGGVRATTGTGRIDVRVPSGSVEARVRESGDVLVRAASPAWAAATVETRVGTAGMALDGRAVPPLPGPGPGQRLEARDPAGAPGDRFTLRTEIGHARLEVDRRAAAAPPPGA